MLQSAKFVGILGGPFLWDIWYMSQEEGERDQQNRLQDVEASKERGEEEKDDKEWVEAGKKRKGNTNYKRREIWSKEKDKEKKWERWWEWKKKEKNGD